LTLESISSKIARERRNSPSHPLAHGTTTPREEFMSQLMLVPVDRPEAGALPISERLRAQLVYFMTPPGSPGVPELGEDEYWIARADVLKWLADGAFYLISPLDSENMAEVELTEDQELLLAWLETNGIQHVRVVWK
jgi:hypothetical protein